MTKPKPVTRIETNPIKRLELEKFTAFDKLAMDFSPGLNVIIGANSTGKTHILKVLYAACREFGAGKRGGFGEVLRVSFRPHGDDVGRLINRGGDGKALVQLEWQYGKVYGLIERTNEDGGYSVQQSAAANNPGKVKTTFVPVKEMLAHAPGFRSLYNAREISYDDTYDHLIDLAYLPPLKNLPDESRSLLERIEAVIQGTIEIKGEHFFLKDKKGELEFSLLSEGFRKFALLWLLIKNGSLSPGSVLLWDEPETNLNPKLQGTIVEVLMELQRAGVQVFIATHNYVLLKEIDLRTKPQDQGRVAFHSLYRDNKQVIRTSRSENYLQIEKNVIEETYLDLYNRQLDREIEGGQG